MPARPILLYPDPRLKTPCEAVDQVGDDVRALVRDLLDTIDAGPPRTVGIAAPQVGAMVRVAIVDASRNPKFDPGHGLLTLINPVISAHSGEQNFREGCLSIPEYTANIRRHARITVLARGLDGTEICVDAEGFEAVILQHEIDHLNGILFLDRVANVKTDLFTRKARS
ncbi:MAG: peptide deformylase [Capsulimonadaceae bacterium]